MTAVSFRLTRVLLCGLAAVLCLFLLPGVAAAKALTVTSAMPRGEVRDLAQITVRFSEDMRPLGVMEEARKTAPLTLSVPHGTLPAGTFRWLDPSTLAYIFDKPVDRPLAIRATVPKGAASLTGSSLAAETAWDISTPALELTLGNGRVKSLPRKNATITLYSNYPLNSKALREKSHLTANGKALRFTLSKGREYRYHQGRPSWWQYTYSVKDDIPRDADVSLTVEQGVTARAGGVPAARASFSLRGFGGLALTGWNIDGTGTKGPNAAPPHPENRLTLSFNNPVAYSDLLAHVTVTPEPVTPRGDEWSRTYTNTGFTLPYAWEPRTTYTVTVNPGLKDTNGTSLSRKASFTFTTGDYRPFMDMQTGSLVLERALSDAFPLTLLNMGTVTAAVRYLPWGKDAFRALGRHAEPATASSRAPDGTTKGARRTTAVIDTTDRPNRTLRETLDLPKLLGLPPDAAGGGLITAKIVPPEESAGDAVRAYFANRTFQADMQITDLGIVARMADARSLAWVTSIQSGKPVAGAELRLLDTNGGSLWSGKTDASGLAVLPGLASLSSLPRFCAARTGDDYSVLDLAYGGMPEDKAKYGQSKAQSEAWKIHAVSQLSLYRPGQTVNAAVYVRRHTDENGERPYASWLPVTGEALHVEITDRAGKVAHAFDARTNAYGSVAFSFTLARDAEPGWYVVRATSKATPSEMTAFPFQVASFRPPEFKVDLTPPPSQPVPADRNQRLSVAVTAGYFSGALLAGGSVQMDVDTASTWFAPPRLSGYATGPDHPFGLWHYHGRERERATVTGRLDARGDATLELPVMEKSLYPRTLFMAATVTDAANLTSQGTAACLLHPSEYYVGIRAPYIAREKQETAVQYKAATWDDKPLTGKAVSLKAERITWENGKEKRETVWEKPLTLADESGDRVTVSFDRSGQYLLTAGITDGQGRENVAATRVYVPGRLLTWARTAGYDSGRLDLLAEDKLYRPGDTARLVIKNPFERATALVAVERNGVRRTFVREVHGDTPVIDVPVEKEDAPYVYASVLLVRGRSAPPPASGAAAPSGRANPDNGPDREESGDESIIVTDKGAPTLWQGTALLKVTGMEPALAVTVSTDKTEYRPGGTVAASARVTERGKGRKAQVTFLAVDERVLRAGGEFNTYNPYATFEALYPNRIIGADTWSRLVRHHRRTAGPDMLLRARQAAPAAPAADAMLARETAAGQASPEPSVREDFSPLAFWLAEGETDANGTLSVTFTLPDSLTSYRVVAVAADTQDGFATAATSVRAAKPLQLLPALPKFVTEGDRLDAGILVQNTGKDRGEAEITLSVTGASFQTGKEPRRTVTLDAGQSGLVVFPLRVATLEEPAGELRLRATGRMGTETDAAEFVLPVRPALPVTHVAAAGLLAEGETYTLPVKAPANLDARSRLEVTFAPSPAAGIPLAAKQLVNYRWNCLEQRLSRAWARIIRLEHGALLGLAPDAGDREALREEFEAVPAHQRQDGSFTLWPGMGGGGDDGGLGLFITAYVLLVGHEGAAVGLALPGEVIDQALAYLEKTLSALPASGVSQEKEGDKANLFEPAPETYALALRVLALHKPERAARLFPRVLALCGKKDTSPLGWAALLLTMDDAKISANKAKTTARILETLGKTASATPTHLHFATLRENLYWRTLGSSLRDNAMLLAALATAQRDYPRLEALAAWVGQRLGDTRTLTTQEAAFGLWGLATYLGSLGGDRETAIHAVWNGTDEASASFSRLTAAPESWRLPASKLNGGNASNLNLTAEKGRPYWTARLAYASPDLPVKVENAGFTLERTVDATGPRTVGEVVEVTLTLTVPATRRHVLLFDPFPAGFEPLYTSRVDLMARERWRSDNDGPWRWEDALDDGMLLYAPVAHPGTYTYRYKLRAAASGVFTQRPSSVEEMYTPEVFGRTDKGLVEIRAQ